MEAPSSLIDILNHSPSAELLKAKYREQLILFFATVFSEEHKVVAQETLYQYLSDFLDHQALNEDEETTAKTFDEKAKNYIRTWTNKGFLTNYQDEQGDIFYELSSHTIKVLDWIGSLKKEEYIGTESKFKNIFNQLKELVEFTNEDKEKRLEILLAKRDELQAQIDSLQAGEDVKVFEEYEIIPRFNQLTQQAKELLSDFKEVEDNFKNITKEIYQKHSGQHTKDDILQFTFDALDQLKESPQGKSFYAFWSFLLMPDLQEEWNSLTEELYNTLQQKNIAVNDTFLRSMKNHLYYSGEKVSKANDKMAEKLSRIIRETENSDSEATKATLSEIKKLLIDISKRSEVPDISFELETFSDINIPFERKLTNQKREVTQYTQYPKNANTSLTDIAQLDKLFARRIVDRETVRKYIREVLREKKQATLADIVAKQGGVKDGLAELVTYLSVGLEFKHLINEDKTQEIIFDTKNHKRIQLPEIIISL
jgi:hypothetical protein